MREGGVLKKKNMLTTSPNPTPNPFLHLTPQFFIILHSPGIALQTSDFEVDLHLHYATKAVVANLLIFVGL